MIHRFIFIFLFLFTYNLFGQFEGNKHIVGPSAGFSFLGSAVQLGLNHEYGFELSGTKNDKIGKLGVGGIFRYWSYTEVYPAVEWSYSNVVIGVQTNYHFPISNIGFDPWAGVIMAYNLGSIKSKILLQNVQFGKVKNGGILFGANAGMRYWVDPNTALSMRIGFGTQSYGAIDLGLEYILD